MIPPIVILYQISLSINVYNLLFVDFFYKLLKHFFTLYFYDNLNVIFLQPRKLILHKTKGKLDRSFSRPNDGHAIVASRPAAPLSAAIICLWKNRFSWWDGIGRGQLGMSATAWKPTSYVEHTKTGIQVSCMSYIRAGGTS